MMTHAIRKRRKECSSAAFLGFVLCCAALITLPGFLFFYFWEGAGFMISSLIGFLIGSFALSTLEVIGPVVVAIRRVFRNPAKPEARQTESQHGIDDA
jgi:membrane protein implicated in regulation of membrane protease activity